MEGTNNLKSYQERMSSIMADPEFQLIQKKYQPYLDLHGIEEILGVFDIKQAPPGEAITGKLIWHSEYDLPIDLKKDITKIFNKYFVN
ncbi:hypothetical protein [Mucilaginibacter sp.]